MFRAKSRGPICPDCGSSNLETADNGQVTCLGCGYVVRAAQHVSETQDFDETKMVNMRMIRTVKSGDDKRKKRSHHGPTAKQIREERIEEKDLLNRTQAFELLESLASRLVAIGFTEFDLETAKEDMEKVFPRREARLVSSGIAKRVFGVVHLHINEPMITTWDLTHLGLSGVVPCLEYGAIEYGVSPWVINEIREKSLPEKSVPETDIRAVTMRFAVRLAKVLGFPYPQMVWRAAWIVMFGLGGWAGRSSDDAASIAAGVVAGVVLLKGWDERVLALKKEEMESFSFSPYGDFFPFFNLLDVVHRSRRTRVQQYKRQTHVIRNLGPIGEAFVRKTTQENIPQEPGELNSHFQAIFEKRVASVVRDEEEDLDIPFGGCDGTCLEDYKRYNQKANALTGYNSLLDLRFWTAKMENKCHIYTERALKDLSDLGHRGVDFYLHRAPRGRQDFLTEVRAIATAATKFQLHETIEQFYEDNVRICDLGCQRTLCCPRVFRERTWSEAQVVQRCKKSGARYCGECAACQRQVDCGKCEACLDKPEFGGIATDHEVKPCALRVCVQILNAKKKARKATPSSKKKRARNNTNTPQGSSEDGDDDNNDGLNGHAAAKHPTAQRTYYNDSDDDD